MMSRPHLKSSDCHCKVIHLKPLQGRILFLEIAKLVILLSLQIAVMKKVESTRTGCHSNFRRIVWKKRSLFIFIHFLLIHFWAPFRRKFIPFFLKTADKYTSFCHLFLQYLQIFREPFSLFFLFGWKEVFINRSKSNLLRHLLF